MRLLPLSRYLALLAQLALFLYVIQNRFELESPAFVHVTMLAAGGFALNALLPERFRVAFFVALSVAGMAVVLGPATAVWLVALSVAMIALAHAPVPFAGRVALVVAAGAALTALRGGAAPVPWSAAVWPLLGSMLMFRMIVYLYDLRHVRERVPVATRAAYFFLLPNICFPLFPVVDFRTFLNSRRARDPWDVYQKGMFWMFRGMIQLVLYRLVYYYATLSMDQVATVGELGRFLLSNYLLYLRISGQFHVIVGMLCLFGFDLPETNHRYLLASSLTDFWRRINIYWKDFMVKIVYMPVYFRAKALGPRRATVVATVVVFVVTWLLHSYQWFWLRGTFPVAAPDILFWSVLGLLVIVNSLHELSHGRARSLTQQAWGWGASFRLALRTVGTLTLICILWSLWTCGSVKAWGTLWMSALEGGTAGLVPVVVFYALALGGGTIARYLAGRVGRVALVGPGAFPRSAAVVTASLLAISVLGHRAVYQHFGPFADVVVSLRESRLSRGDLALLQRGYYEELLGVERVNSQLWEVYMKEPAGWFGDPEEIYRLTGDFLYREHAPSATTIAKGHSVTISSLGMRDREYALEKPAGTFRVVLVGDSYGVGLGVAPEETWETIVEDALNADRPFGPGDTEILNLCVGGYGTFQRMESLERTGVGFRPDAVLFLAHGTDTKILRDLSDPVRLGVEVPHPELVAMAEAANVTVGTAEAVAERRLRDHAPELIGWAYRRVVSVCRDRDILPIWLYLPTTAEMETPGQPQMHDSLLALAREAGFVIVDLNEVYAGQNLDEIRFGDWDRHPNREGHALIARAVLEALRSSPDVAARASRALSEAGGGAKEGRDAPAGAPPSGP